MEHSTYLTFLIGSEYFAVNVEKVLEVLQHQNITAVPKTPEHILGIINFRGEILPVVDTKIKFNIKNNEEKSKIIIVFELANGETKSTIAATADSVKDVINIFPDEIKPVPELGISYNSNYLAGAIRRDELFILLLDVDKIFSAKDFAEIAPLELNEKQN